MKNYKKTSTTAQPNSNTIRRRQLYPQPTTIRSRHTMTLKKTKKQSAADNNTIRSRQLYHPQPTTILSAADNYTIRSRQLYYPQPTHGKKYHYLHNVPVFFNSISKIELHGKPIFFPTSFP
jgi:ribosomal protein S21